MALGAFTQEPWLFFQSPQPTQLQAPCPFPCPVLRSGPHAWSLSPREPLLCHVPFESTVASRVRLGAGPPCCAWGCTEQIRTDQTLSSSAHQIFSDTHNPLSFVGSHFPVSGSKKQKLAPTDLNRKRFIGRLWRFSGRAKNQPQGHTRPQTMPQSYARRAWCQPWPRTPHLAPALDTGLPTTAGLLMPSPRGGWDSIASSVGGSPSEVRWRDGRRPGWRKGVQVQRDSIHDRVLNFTPLHPR